VSWFILSYLGSVALDPWGILLCCFYLPCAGLLHSGLFSFPSVFSVIFSFFLVNVIGFSPVETRCLVSCFFFPFKFSGGPLDTSRLLEFFVLVVHVVSGVFFLAARRPWGLSFYKFLLIRASVFSLPFTSVCGDPSLLLVIQEAARDRLSAHCCSVFLYSAFILEGFGLQNV
jgi:hypothetical protein